jgi:hypothetical protein
MPEAQRSIGARLLPSAEIDTPPDLPLCYGDLPYRLQRALRLIPAKGLGVGRRAVVTVIITWLPIAIAAASAGRLRSEAAQIRLLDHYGLNAMFLVAIPVLIIGEMMLDRLTQKKIAHFVRSGLVTDADRSEFTSIVARAIAWRDAWRPWLLAAVVIAAWTLMPGSWNVRNVLWANEPQWSLRFGAAWYAFVARPIFFALVLTWFWRLTMFGVLLAWIASLPLSLVPTHPDRACGLGFLGDLPHAFAPLTFALACVLSAQWAHDAVFHDVPLEAFVGPIAAFVVVTTLMVLAPLLVFSTPLVEARRQATLDYGALACEQGRLLRRRWILGEPLQDDRLLTSSDLGPAADAAAVYDGVQHTRSFPFSAKTRLWVVIPIVAPMLPLLAIEMHLLDALRMVFSTLR